MATIGRPPRSICGITTTEIVEITGCKKPTVWSWVSGRRDMPLAIAHQILAARPDVDAAELLGELAARRAAR